MFAVHINIGIMDNNSRRPSVRGTRQSQGVRGRGGHSHPHVATEDVVFLVQANLGRTGQNDRLGLHFYDNNPTINNQTLYK